MRRTFQKALLNEMMENDKIFLLTADLGYKMFDSHFAAFPDRVLNTGAAEQAMLDIAVGLAYDGKIPFCYTITPFFYRGFETIRTYINHEKLPVHLIGSGRDRDYAHDGMSHWSDDIEKYLDQMENIHQYWPRKKSDIKVMVKAMVNSDKPSFISLQR